MADRRNSKAYWGKVAKSYDKLVSETGDKAHSLVINPIVLNFLGDLKGKIVLDAGCGNGYWSRRLAQRAKKVVGIDFTEELIRIAESKLPSHNLEFRQGNLKELKFPDSKFDVVLCNMVLIDVDDLDKVIGELARVLKPNGVLIASITHPCFENPPNTTTLEDKKGRKIGRLVKHYFKVGLVVDTNQNWDTQREYQHYHYMISDYLNAFARHGLCLIKTSEPNWVEMTGEGDYSHTPYFIIWKLRKLAA